MLRSFLCVGLMAASMGAPIRLLHADDPTPWQQEQFKKLSGRWTTIRIVKSGKDEFRKIQVDLEFAAGELKVESHDPKDGKRLSQDKLKVVDVAAVNGLGGGSHAKLIVGGNASQKAEVSYDFVGDKLVLVGRVGWRPWEGFSLSGEYQRPEKSK